MTRRISQAGSRGLRMVVKAVDQRAASTVINTNAEYRTGARKTGPRTPIHLSDRVLRRLHGQILRTQAGSPSHHGDQPRDEKGRFASR